MACASQTVDSAYEFLRENNTGKNKDGQTFGEVMPHYFLGGDETCLLASAGDVTVIADKQKAKHEKETANSRTSITMYRTGSSAGADGPTAFLPPGVAPPVPALLSLLLWLPSALVPPPPRL